jgi:hypothetical protein
MLLVLTKMISHMLSLSVAVPNYHGSEAPKL